MNVYEFNINNVKSPNLTDPLGFHIQIADTEENRKKVTEVDEVKRSVSNKKYLIIRKQLKFRMDNSSNYFYQFFHFIWLDLNLACFLFFSFVCMDLIH